MNDKSINVKKITATLTNPEISDTEKIELVLQLDLVNDKQIIPVLTGLLKKTSPAVKEKIIYQLGKSKAPELADTLVSVLSDPENNNDTRMAAIMALKQIGRNDLSEPFMQAIQGKVRKRQSDRWKKKEGKRAKQKISNNITMERNDGITCYYISGEISNHDTEAFKSFIDSIDPNKIETDQDTLHLNFIECRTLINEFKKILQAFAENFRLVFYLNKGNTDIIKGLAEIPGIKLKY